MSDIEFEHDETDTGGSKWPDRIKLRAIHPEHGEVGWLQYRVPRRKADKIAVDRLEVHEEHRGKGYASQLMDEMQRRHPGTPIDHGTRTDDGRAWWAGYTRDKKVTKGRTMASSHPQTERVDHIVRNYSFADGNSWSEVKDNYDLNHPKMREMREDIRQNGIRKPIKIDYDQSPPQVVDGHTRLLHAETLGMEHVPVEHSTFHDAHPAPIEWSKKQGPDYERMARNEAEKNGHRIGDFSPHPKMNSIQIATCQDCGANAMHTPMRVGGKALEETCTVKRTVSRKTAGDDWNFEHFQVGNSSSWRSMGGPKDDPRRHGLQYTVPEPGKVVFHHDGYQNAVESLRERKGPEAADRMEKAVLDHHGATGTDSRAEEAARPVEPEKPKRRVYYHGTTVDGVTHILPASHHGGHVVFPQMTSHEHAYATTNHDDAWTYAQKAWASTGKGRPRVYQVRPIGGHQHVEKDPSHDQHGRSRDNNEEDVRSKKGFEVVREMKMPKHMGDPQEWDS